MSFIFSKFPLATALQEAWKRGYTLSDFRADCLAGVTVSILAIPLAMALAIAVGVAPEHGLYTAIIAGAIIAVLGGSQLSVSGPTAAFVVILAPLVKQYGLPGLLVATSLAGLYLVIFGILKLGSWVKYIPYSIIAGFTAGIAVVIASLQIKDFLGITLENHATGFIRYWLEVLKMLPYFNIADALIGGLTLSSLILLSRWQYKMIFPPQMVAIIVSASVAFILQYYYPELTIQTIATRFSQIPQSLPPFILPWKLLRDDKLVFQLLFPAFTIAGLCAIESLLCARMLDRLTKNQHQPNVELIAQGIGNIVISCFAGITATSAIARSVINYRAGGRSPLSAVIHSLVILLVVIYLGHLFSYIPLASLAGLLLMTAWNLGDVKHCWTVIRLGSRVDTLLFILTFILTVLFDMVIGVSIGVLVAMVGTKLKLKIGMTSSDVFSEDASVAE